MVVDVLEHGQAGGLCEYVGGFPRRLEGLLELTRRLRSVEMAAAPVSAEGFDALVLTAHPDHYVDADGEPHERVIGI